MQTLFTFEYLFTLSYFHMLIHFHTAVGKVLSNYLIYRQAQLERPHLSNYGKTF